MVQKIFILAFYAGVSVILPIENLVVSLLDHSDNPEFINGYDFNNSNNFILYKL